MSCSDDSKIIYWNLEDNKKIILRCHQNGVTSVDALYNDGEITVASSSADSTVRLWRFNPDLDHEADSFQVFDILRNGICFNVKLFAMPDVGILLAYATDDDKIHLFGENFSKCFERLETLVGHEDWVRGLDFTNDKRGDVLLASSSQDSFIRLWRISSKPDTDVICDESLLQVEERTFVFAGKKFLLSLESVLQGHENWVYSVHWSKDPESHTLQLLSSSMDKTMIIWTFDKEQKLWTEKLRVGDVGGNSLGFYGAKFNSSGNSVIGHGFQGSLHLWHQNAKDDRLWESGAISGGHFKEVKDIAWEPNGEFLFSTSVDQTTRIHARNGNSSKYYEIARPQVHGYDMQCLAVLSRYRFASAAEEKIVRTFQAPGNFVENLRNLVGLANDAEGDAIIQSHQKGASVPSLGLSNKAVYDNEIDLSAVEDKKFKDEYPENYFVPMSMTEETPPTEEYLAQNTLWPELQKLYAHGYELYSLAATRDGKILASACKATSVDHAEIILWDTKSWNIIQRMLSHKLTVTSMKFSSDGKRLLSVSRDRLWTLFEKFGSSEQPNFEIVASSSRNNGIHERIIWTCCWTHDDKFFATGSRDGKVVAWTKASIKDEVSSLGDYKAVEFSMNLRQSSVTALAFANTLIDGCYLLATGLECGKIHLHKFNGESFELLKTLDHSEAHHLAVNKLEFQPNHTGDVYLASCSADHFVKIHGIRL